MRIVEVIGSVTLSRVHPTLVGARWLIGAPFSLKGLREGRPDGEDLVIYDRLGAGPGSRIGIGEGGEAAAPLLPEKKPIDAYCACLLDQVVINEE
jgi:ethanolamine utilization protein EutN